MRYFEKYAEEKKSPAFTARFREHPEDNMGKAIGVGAATGALVSIPTVAAVNWDTRQTEQFVNRELSKLFDTSPLKFERRLTGSKIGRNYLIGAGAGATAGAIGAPIMYLLSRSLGKKKDKKAYT